jgi:hypothetical protein
MIPNLSAVILDRAARPLIEPEISGIDAELASHEDNDVIRHLSPAARKPAIPAAVLQQHREAQSGRSPPRGEKCSILIQQGPELDQLINFNRSRLHAPQSSPPVSTLTTGLLGLVTAPLPTPQVVQARCTYLVPASGAGRRLIGVDRRGGPQQLAVPVHEPAVPDQRIPVRPNPAMPITAGQPPRQRHDEGPTVCPRGLHLGLWSAITSAKRGANRVVPGAVTADRNYRIPRCALRRETPAIRPA